MLPSRLFQSTPLREGRQWIAKAYESAKQFQSTPLREGRHAFTDIYTSGYEFQSTPLREGRLFDRKSTSSFI
tara:strand:- start:32272 stop:32487 length:216 start_codon:yes stop_codon:yes gene_type:complete